jgi:hypothetical protein
MYLKVIACEIAFREICACAARSVNLFDFEFLSQGYHDNPEIGISRIQECLDAIEEDRFDAVLLGYGLCNTMLNGLRAPSHTPLVVLRAHDCITFFLGSKERYQEFFQEHPGTYYFTAGWLEHRERGGERPDRKQGAEMGPKLDYEEMVAKYGEENAAYLIQVMGDWTDHYQRGVFIDFDFTCHLPHKHQARELCEERGWEYEEIEGDLSLLQKWLDGPWSEDGFLTVPPGQQVFPSYDEQIIQIGQVT